MGAEFSQQNLSQIQQSLQNDPVYLRLMEAYQQAKAQYSAAQASGQFGRDMQNYRGPNPAVAAQNVSNYVQNHPNSAGRVTGGANRDGGDYAYNYDPNTQQFGEFGHVPWYADPAFWGPIAVGAATAGFGALGGASSGSGSAAASAPVSVGSSAIPGATLGVPAALPGAVSSVPALAGTAATTAPALASTVGQGVRPGLLGPSAETATDVYEANNSGFHLPTGTGGKILQALTALGSAGLGHVLSNQSGQGNVPPELQQMLQLALSRAKSQQPLFDASNRGLYDMLPNFARTGGS